MQTTCPECQTVYNITQEQLSAANGEVICSVCLHQFDSYKSLKFDSSPKVSPEEKQETKPAEQISTGRSNNLAYALLILMLFLVLPIQMLFFEKDAMAQNTATRPVIENFCHLAGCEIEVFRNLKKIELISRKVHSHPVEKGALIITATIMNTASQEQPFPKLLISMDNIKGKTGAQRIFQPEEYIPEELEDEVNMPAHIPMNINLEIVDPGQDLVSFEIDFLP